MIDTAGIRKTDDIVESIGVEKSLSLIEEADLVLVVLNNNEKLTDEDQEILDKIKDKNNIVIINKIDLESKLDKNIIDSENIVKMSVTENIGIDCLKETIKKLFNLDKIEQADYTYLSTARSISLLRQSLISLDNVEQGINLGMPIDMIEIDLKNVWNILGDIIGANYSDELIDQLFSQFCLGK